MIELTDIDFRYPNADFRLYFEKLSFQSGSKTAVIGPSGYGKTTLLNLISGIFVPLQGKVTVLGVTVNLMSDAARRNFRLLNVGFIFQDFKLLDYLNVFDNILLPYRINRALKLDVEIKVRVKEIASRLNIEDKLSKFPDKLSQGERQRVAICRALLNEPQLILADEPTGNLDPENKHRILNILFDYVKGKGSSLITVTHDIELLKGFDKVIDFKMLHS